MREVLSAAAAAAVAKIKPSAIVLAGCTENIADAIGKKAEDIGLDVFATGEHHNPPFVASAPTTTLAYIGAQTERLNLDWLHRRVEGGSLYRLPKPGMVSGRLESVAGQCVVSRGDYRAKDDGFLVMPDLVTLVIPGGWQSLASGIAKQHLEQLVLPGWLMGQRWFKAKSKAAPTGRGPGSSNSGRRHCPTSRSSTSRSR